MLLGWFQQFFGHVYHILLVEGSSETGLFRHLSNHVFRVRNFGNTKAVRVIFFFKTFKIYSRFPKCSKKFKKVFCLWDNCIWIDIVKLSLLTTGYFSLAANVLTSSPKIWNVNKRKFFGLNFLPSDQWIWKRCCDADFNSRFGHFSDVPSRSIL